MYKYIEELELDNWDIKEKSIKKYEMLASIFIIITAFFVFQSTINKYYIGTGIIDNKILNSSILSDDLKKILANKKIKIGGTTFTYQLQDTTDIYNIKGEKYQNIKLNLPEYQIQKEDVIEYKIVYGKNSIVKEFLKYWGNK